MRDAARTMLLSTATFAVGFALVVTGVLVLARSSRGLGLALLAVGLVVVVLSNRLFPPRGDAATPTKEPDRK